jgi:hypothetical protein
MRALSFLFAALLGIALAMIAPALAGPASSGAGIEPIAAQTAIASHTDLAEPVQAAEASLTAELENSLMVELGLDALQPGDAA